MLPNEFETFIAKGLVNAAQWNYDPSLVNEAMQVLTTLFGREWLVTQITREDRSTPLPFRRHPLGNSLVVGSEEGILRVLELSAYLQRFASDPALPTVVKNFIATYGSTTFQLAMAYRMSLLASSTRLEPSTERGKYADVEVWIDNLRAVAECYIPRLGARDPSPAEAQRLGIQLLKCSQHTRYKYSFAAVLSDVLDASCRKEIVAAARRLVEAVEGAPSGFLEGVPGALERRGAWCLSVMRTWISGPGQFSNLVLHPEFPLVEDVDPVFSAREQKGSKKDFGLEDREPQLISGSHCVIWIIDTESEMSADLYIQSLSSLLQKKVTQTRSGEARRIVMVQSSRVFAIDVEETNHLSDSCLQLMRAHERFDAATFHHRYFDYDRHRYRYLHKVVINPLAPEKIQTFIRSMRDWDEKYVVPAGQ